MTLLIEEHNRTTIEYKLRTPFRKINMERIIEDINEIDGIYSTEQVGTDGRSSMPSPIRKLWPFNKGPKKPPSM